MGGTDGIEIQYGTGRAVGQWQRPQTLQALYRGRGVGRSCRAEARFISTLHNLTAFSIETHKFSLYGQREDDAEVDWRLLILTSWVEVDGPAGMLCRVLGLNMMVKQAQRNDVGRCAWDHYDPVSL